MKGLMKMGSKWKKAIIIVMFLAVGFFNSTSSTLAITEHGIIKIILEPLEEPQSKRGNTIFNLYRVGNVVDGVPQIYKKYHISYYPQTAEDTKYVSHSILENLDATPILTGATDKNGELIFSNIDDGVYLLIAQHPNAYGDVTPTLLHLPYHEVVDDQVSDLLYQITVNPKAVYPNNKPNHNTNKEPHKKPEKPNENVSTSDTSKRALYAMMMAVAVGGIYVFYKRKKAMSNE